MAVLPVDMWPAAVVVPVAVAAMAVAASRGDGSGGAPAAAVAHSQHLVAAKSHAAAAMAASV